MKEIILGLIAITIYLILISELTQPMVGKNEVVIEANNEKH
jgi:hypothetical protein